MLLIDKDIDKLLQIIILDMLLLHEKPDVK